MKKANNVEVNEKMDKKQIAKRNKSMRKEYTATFYHKNKWSFSAALITLAIGSALEVALAYILQELLDAANGSDTSELIDILILSGIFFVVFMIIQLLQKDTKFAFVKKAMRQYKSKAFEEITKKNISTFATEKTGSYISALTNDAISIENNYVHGIFGILSMFVLFFGALGMMFWYNWSMTLVVIGLCLIPIAISILFGSKLAAQEQEISNHNEGFVAMVKDLLSGFTVIKSFKAEKESMTLFNERNDNLESIKCKRKKTEATINIVSGGAGFIVQIGVFLYGAYLSINGEITAGVVIAFVQLMNYVLQPIQRLPSLLANKKAAETLIDKFAAYSTNNADMSGKEVIDDIGSGISCENVTFGFDEGKEILKGIDMKFEKGKSYAIVGASGSGKSTLLNLFLGSYHNYEGKITFNDKELREIKGESLYDIVSIIQQNVFVFDSSIVENITMFKEFDKAKINDAIQRSGLSKLIEEKGEAYHCGENGSHLSGGERQRISIARSLLKDTSVLLVDEATAALDPETATNVSNAILDIEGLTRIIVTHKLDETLLRRFDEILVLRNGTIVENGAFDVLIGNKQYFYSLYNISSDAA
jgi:ABC-type multidrug transport system fused ATPase/permease subunit